MRIGFLVVALGLLCGLALLFSVVQKRLAAAQKERAQMVAERVFDELEHEVSVFLDVESERGRYVQLEETDPTTWAPFVVGYFRLGDNRLDLAAANGSPEENERRIKWALRQAKAKIQLAKQSDPQPSDSKSKTPAIHDSESDSKQSSTRQTKVKKRAKKLRPTRQQAKPNSAPAEGAPGSPSKSKSKSSGTDIIQQLNRAPERRAIPQQRSSPSNEQKDQFDDYLNRY